MSVPPKQKSKRYTYETRVFSVEIAENPETKKKGLKIMHDRFFQHEINKFKIGDKCSMTITNKKPKRTMEQNAYYWGVILPLVSHETGEQDINALHELFKGKFLTTKIRRVLGQPVRLEKSTTELSVGDFCNYIVNIAQETGIEPPPTENFGLAPLRHTHKLSTPDGDKEIE